MAAAGTIQTRPPWANSNSENEAPSVNIKQYQEPLPTIEDNEIKLFKKEFFTPTISSVITTRHSNDRYYYTISLFYAKTRTKHTCNLKVFIPKTRYAYDEEAIAMFDIYKEDTTNSSSSCISITYKYMIGFPFDESNISQNSRIEGEAHCFNPPIPGVEGDGNMTTFLQILSTKLKYRFMQALDDESPIHIMDAATVDDSSLPLFLFRLMRGHPEPSIYQKYGYQLRGRHGYVTRLNKHVSEITIGELTDKLNRIVGEISKVTGVQYDDTTTIAALLKDIRYDIDNTYKFSESLYKIIFGTMYTNPILLFEPSSPKWKKAEELLIVTDIEYGADQRFSDPFDFSGESAREGGGGAAASASGGARRRRTQRLRSSKRKTRRGRGRPKLDRVRAA